MSDPTPAQPIGGAANGSRILVVDDEKPIRIVAQRMLERLGYAVSVAGGPAEAMSLVADAPACFDLALVDVNLAGESGLILATELQRVVGELPIVIMGGDVDGSMRGGTVRHLLPKPFSFSDLSRVVAAAIQTATDRDSSHADSCLSDPGAIKIPH